MQDNRIDREKHIAFLEWYMLEYFGMKAATPNQFPRVVDKYLNFLGVPKSNSFIQWLDEDIAYGMKVLERTEGEKDRAHIVSAISVLHDVKRKYLSLISIP